MLPSPRHPPGAIVGNGTNQEREVARPTVAASAAPLVSRDKNIRVRIRKIVKRGGKD